MFLVFIIGVVLINMVLFGLALFDLSSESKQKLTSDKEKSFEIKN